MTSALEFIQKDTVFMILISLTVVSIISLIASYLSSFITKNSRCLRLIINLAIGSLLGSAFIHLIPESFEQEGDDTLKAIMIILGIGIFLIIEKYLHWHHLCNELGHTHKESCKNISNKRIFVNDSKKEIGYINLFADLLHNFIDGVIITVSFLTNTTLGFASFFAILAHELPQEIGDFTVLIYSGWPKKKALLANLAVSLSSFLGAFLVLGLFFVFGSSVFNNIEAINSYIIAIVAGGFIYLALTDLMPASKEHNHEKKQLNEKNEYSSLSFFSEFADFAFIALGVLIMFLLRH